MRAVQRVPAKAAAVVLDPSWPMPQALRHIVRCCLVQLRANDTGAARSRNREFLHQARIALRRTRSALKLQRPADDAVVALNAELKWLAGELGAVRDWDVLLEDVLQPMAGAYAAASPAADFTRLLNAVRRTRGRARRQARTALISGRYAALLQALEAWLGSPAATDSQADTLPRLAARELRRRHKRLLRDATGFLHQTPEQRHAIRIDAKRLRYAVEFYASLFPGKAARRYRRELARLQDALGELNDAATAARLLADLPRHAGTAPFIRGWLAGRETVNLAAAEAALARLTEIKRFW